MGKEEILVKMYPELLGVLKDIANYMEKQDATQEKAQIDKPPKMKETAKPIVGGTAPSGKPGTGVAKEFVPMSTEDTSAGENADESLEGKNKETMLKAEDEDESLEEVDEEDEEDDGENSDEKSKFDEELKSLLKDIKTALSKQVNVQAEIQKALPPAMEKMLRKMGFAPTRPDVVKMSNQLGIDQTAVIRKSEDETGGDSEDKKVDEVIKGIDNLSKKSFTQLGEMREKLGHFNAFGS